MYVHSIKGALYEIQSISMIWIVSKKVFNMEVAEPAANGANRWNSANNGNSAYF